MIDTRRPMTRAQFDEAAASMYDNWWLTGEDSFLHVSPVMDVEGWNFYGHPGNERLTEPQRVLMMWSDLVGQTSNGGFEQFVYNYRDSLALSHRLIAKLEWPELFERFDRAFREHAGDPLDPHAPEDEAIEDWPVKRQRIIDHLARQLAAQQPTNTSPAGEIEALPDTILSMLYKEAVEDGEIDVADDDHLDVDPVTEAANAFDDWFYLDETKAASRTFVGGYIVRHRDDLCRLID